MGHSLPIFSGGGKNKVGGVRAVTNRCWGGECNADDIYDHAAANPQSLQHSRKSNCATGRSPRSGVAARSPSRPSRSSSIIVVVYRVKVYSSMSALRHYCIIYLFAAPTAPHGATCAIAYRHKQYELL